MFSRLTTALPHLRAQGVNSSSLRLIQTSVKQTPNNAVLLGRLRSQQQVIRQGNKNFHTQSKRSAIERRRPDDGKPRTLMEGKPFSELTPVEKVVETSKDVGSIGVILVGVGLAGAMLWAIAGDLLFNDGPEKQYEKALDVVKNDYRVQDLMGSTIRPYGGARGKRAMQHQAYQHGNAEYLRMAFHVEGDLSKGVVQLELKKSPDTGNKYKYRYFFIDVPGGNLPSQRIIIEDNRNEE